MERLHRVAALRRPPTVGRHWVERIRPGGYQSARPAAPQRASAQTPQTLPPAGLAGSAPISPRPQAGRTSTGTLRPQPDERWSQSSNAGSNADALHQTVANGLRVIAELTRAGGDWVFMVVRLWCRAQANSSPSSSVSMAMGQGGRRVAACPS